MATPFAPRSSRSARVACRSMGPGVVRLPASLSTAAPVGSNAPSVPMAPIGQSALKTWRARITDVVFPFVPVTPIICSWAAGRRYHASAAMAAARRPLRTRTCGMATGCLTSTNAAAAPRAAAAATNWWPSSTAPRTAQNSMPRSSRRASAVSPVMAGMELGRVSAASIKAPARASASTTSCNERLTGGIGGREALLQTSLQSFPPSRARRRRARCGE